MGRLRTYSEVLGGTASDVDGQLAARAERVRRRLANVRHTVAVLSGKGGVGKSVVSAALALGLAREGLAVGVLDADINGPSIARLLGADRSSLTVGEEGVEPAIGAAGVKFVSMDLLLRDGESPVQWSGPDTGTQLWRGTLEANALREFLADTVWGRLDYLVLDLPPGTDRIAPLHDLLPDLGGAIVVTLPSGLSRFIVGKSLTMLHRLDIPILGYVENMSGYLCPHCEKLGPLFVEEGGSFEGVRRLASIPFDPRFGADADAGRADPQAGSHSAVAESVGEVVAATRSFFEGKAT